MSIGIPKYQLLDYFGSYIIFTSDFFQTDIFNRFLYINEIVVTRKTKIVMNSYDILSGTEGKYHVTLISK